MYIYIQKHSKCSAQERAPVNVCRVLLNVFKAPVSVFKDSVSVCRALLSVYIYTYSPRRSDLLYRARLRLY